MLLIWYNPNLNKFYSRYSNTIFLNKQVGYVNSYGHILVQILAFRRNEILNITSYHDLPNNEKKKEHRFIKRLISFLNKFVS